MSILGKVSNRAAVFGIACSVFLTACGGSGGDEESVVYVQSIPASQQRIIATEDSRVFRTNTLYSADLKDCALADLDSICTLGSLPYIGQRVDQPTVEDIMQRVVVTHDWMGVRFEQMLRRMPSDILDLFAPVTSIVIGSDIRPSSFSPARGRIRLDPGYLWLSVPEKRTISVEDDYRTEFGADLRFKVYWRISLNNDNAIPSSSITDDNEREIGDLDIALARLLYHELAHANDYMHRSNLAGLPDSITPRDALIRYEDSTVWRQLYQQEQLTAQQSYLYGLAAVRYYDDEPTDGQRNMFADFVGSQMSNEGKMTFYGYSSQREDVATLFAAAMMNYHYDVEYDIGFADKPENQETAFCNDYIMGWGVRNRLASPLVVPRAKYVVDKILRPSPERNGFFATGLGDAIPLQTGIGWCDSISGNAAKRPEIAHRQPVELDAE